MNDKLDTEERRELPDSLYGLPSRREYPMPDAAHVRSLFPLLSGGTKA